MVKISDEFEGTVFIPRHGCFAAGDELPVGVTVGDHIPLDGPKKRTSRKDDSDGE